MSSPSNMIVPSVLSISRITIIEVVDLPQPDSPTRPTLSPRAIVKLMPSTARNTSVSGAGLRAEHASRSDVVTPLRGYSFTSFSTTSSGASLGLTGLARPMAARAAAFLLGQQIAQRDAGARRRPHQLARIGDATAP